MFAEIYYLSPVHLKRENLKRQFSRSDQSHEKFNQRQIDFLKNLAVASDGIDDREMNDEARGEVFNLIAKVGNLSKLKIWEAKYNKKISDKFKKFAFWGAAENGHLECLQHLISTYVEKLSLEKKRAEFNIALTTIAMKGHLECLEHFIEKYEDLLNQWDDAFSQAARGGHVACAQLIDSRYGNDISPKTCGEAISYAAAEGHLVSVKYVIEKYGEKISAVSKGSALSSAASKGHLECVIYLLETCKEMIGGSAELAVFRGAERGDVEWLKRVKEVEGWTISQEYQEMAFEKAVAKGHLKCVAYLLDTYEDISSECKEKARAKATGEVRQYLDQYLKTTFTCSCM